MERALIVNHAFAAIKANSKDAQKAKAYLLSVTRGRPVRRHHMSGPEAYWPHAFGQIPSGYHTLTEAIVYSRGDAFEHFIAKEGSSYRERNLQELITLTSAIDLYMSNDPWAAVEVLWSRCMAIATFHAEMDGKQAGSKVAAAAWETSRLVESNYVTKGRGLPQLKPEEKREALLKRLLPGIQDI